MQFRVLCALGLFAACNGSSGAAPDAAAQAPDASACPSTSSTGNVSVTVTQGGAPICGATAYFLAADNTLVATVQTDTAGHAAANLTAGGSVTVVHAGAIDPATPHELESWLDVQPGDELADDLTAVRDDVNRQLSVSAYPGGSAAQYVVMAPCNSGTGYIAAGSAAQLSIDCGVGVEAVDLIAFAVDASSSYIAAQYMSGVPLAGTSTIDLAGTWQPTQSVPIQYANIGSAGQLTVTISTPLAAGLLDDDDIALTAAGGSAAGAFTWPAQLASGTRVVTTNLTEQSIASWAPIGSSVTLDFGGQIAQSIDAYPALDATATSFSWTLSGSGVTPALNIATLAAPAATWTIVSFGAATQIALPQIPKTIVDVSTVGSGVVTGLLVPASVTYRNVLGSGAFFASFAGLIAASPSGVVTETTTPGIPL